MSTGRKKSTEETSPSAVAHRQVVELLQLGERSSNPDIRAAAIEIAKSTSEFQRDRSTRLSPRAIMAGGTVVLLAACGACWYALAHYPGALGDEVSAVVVLIAILLVALYVLLSGHLSQENFVRIVLSVKDWVIRRFSPASSTGSLSGVEAADGAQEPPHKGEPPSEP